MQDQAWAWARAARWGWATMAACCTPCRCRGCMRWGTWGTCRSRRRTGGLCPRRARMQAAPPALLGPHRRAPALARCCSDMQTLQALLPGTIGRRQACFSHKRLCRASKAPRAKPTHSRAVPAVLTACCATPGDGERGRQGRGGARRGRWGPDRACKACDGGTLCGGPLSSGTRWVHVSG